MEQHAEFAEGFADTGRNMGGHFPVTHGTDEQLIVRFYLESEYQKFESDKQGKPVYRDREYVEVLFPGDKTRDYTTRANEEHKRRWPHAYQRFLKQEEVPHEGTPLEQWPQMGKAQVKMLKGENIHTVEQLAGLPDHVAQNFMGGVQLKTQAANWLENAQDGAVLSRLQAENDRLKADLQSKDDQIRDLAARVDVMESNQQQAGGSGELEEMRNMMVVMRQEMDRMQAPAQEPDPTRKKRGTRKAT